MFRTNAREDHQTIDASIPFSLAPSTIYCIFRRIKNVKIRTRNYIIYSITIPITCILVRGFAQFRNCVELKRIRRIDYVWRKYRTANNAIDHTRPTEKPCTQNVHVAATLVRVDRATILQRLRRST